jgi:hypothetical protein
MWGDAVRRAPWGRAGQADMNIKQLGTLGSRMYSLRIDSDYIAHPISDPQAVKKQLERAREFEVLVAQQNCQTPPTALS